MNFLVVKSLHVIAVICWMAAMLYLPRLFVYHSIYGDNEELHRVFCIMEKKLINIIMTPSMLCVIITGTLMLYLDTMYMNYWWMHVKLICVALLIILHKYFMYLHSTFIAKQNNKNDDFFRKINEVPTVIMIVIIFLIILKL